MEDIGYQQRTNMALELSEIGTIARGTQLGNATYHLAIHRYLVGLGIKLNRTQVRTLDGAIVADRALGDTIQAGKLTCGRVEDVLYVTFWPANSPSS